MADFLFYNMATIISNELIDKQLIQMSNSSTSLFFETFCLAGFTIATEEFEKDLLVWFGQHEQMQNTQSV